MQGYFDSQRLDLITNVLATIKRVNPPMFPSALTFTFEAAFQSREFEFSLKLFSLFPELVHSDYVKSSQFADILFQSMSDEDTVIKMMFEVFGVPVHIQTRSGLNLFEYAINLEELEVADYAYKVLGLTSDKPDMLLSWGAMVGNKLMLRYLHNDVGLRLKDTETFLEHCTRSTRSDMVEFAATEMGITTVETLGPLVAAVERAWEISELKPLQDLLDRFAITADVTMLREAVLKEATLRPNVEETVTVYLREVLKLEISGCRPVGSPTANINLVLKHYDLLSFL